MVGSYYLGTGNESLNCAVPSRAWRLSENLQVLNPAVLKIHTTFMDNTSVIASYLSF
jgi:hypothetical protein